MRPANRFNGFSPEFLPFPTICFTCAYVEMSKPHSTEKSEPHSEDGAREHGWSVLDITNLDHLVRVHRPGISFGQQHIFLQALPT